MIKSHVRPVFFLRRLLALVSVILFVPSFPSMVSAAKIKIKPMASVSGRLDTNFYKSPGNEREVYTYAVKPGVQFGVETAKSKVLLSYTLEAFFYDDKSDVPAGEHPADDDNYLGHLAVLDATYTPARRLTLGLNDSFYISQNDAEVDRYNNTVSRDKYWINRLTPLVFYDFENKFSAGFRYRRTDLDYYDSDYGDCTENRGIINLLYNPTRTMTFDLDYQYWTLDYKEGGQEYTSNQLGLTLEKRYHYFSFGAGVGYHNRSYDDPLIENQDTIAYKVSITGQNPPPPETPRSLGEQYIRSRSHVFLCAERNFNNLGYYYDQYSADRLTLSTGHVFLEKIPVRLKGYYQIMDYLAYDREDDRYDLSASVGYRFNPRLVLSITGGREERDSNIDSFDYENKYLYLSFDFNYDLTSRGGYTEESSYYR